MKAILWTRTDSAVVIAVSVLALIIGVLAARLTEAETPTALGSGSEWKCHKLPYIEICNHTAPGKSLPKQADAYASLKSSGVSFEMHPLKPRGYRI
jgi:hypothetical protein